MDNRKLVVALRKQLNVIDLFLAAVDEDMQDKTMDSVLKNLFDAVSSASVSIKVEDTSASETSEATQGEAIGMSKFQRIMKALTGDYVLRTVSAVMNEAGVEDERNLFLTLNQNGAEYVTRVRRADGAKLIGLAERN